MTGTSYPTSDIDLYSDDAIVEPYELYAQLRATGPVVWMQRLGLFALPRYEQVRYALSDWETFSSSRGVMVNDEVNQLVAGHIMLCTDPPEHTQLRKVVRRPLLPKALHEYGERLTREADDLVERLLERDSLDALTDIAQHLPLTVVSKLVGLPEEGRERMLEWATASFNSMGPINERTRAGIEMQAEMMAYGRTRAVPPHLSPDGWAQMMFDAGERGEIPIEKCPHLIPDYLAPSLDTTISATTNAIKLFADNPDQWDAVRADPSLMPNAINEAVRIESPVRQFTRFVTTDVRIDDVVIPAGSRVLAMYASANRDPLKWSDPDRFDVRRAGVAEQLGFGFGEHACVGQGLARLELRCLFAALARRVRRFVVVDEQRLINNTLRAHARLTVRLER